MLTKLLCLALAGSCGTLARYGLTRAVQMHTSSQYPWGTFVVNLVGCLLAGTFMGLVSHRLQISDQTRTIIAIGFMGAFTTFSSFIGETGGLLRDGQWLWAAGNMIGQNAAGILLFFLGLALGRWI